MFCFVFTLQWAVRPFCCYSIPRPVITRPVGQLHKRLQSLRGGSGEPTTASTSDTLNDDSSTKPTSLFILMDGFCPYHSVYMAMQVHEKYPHVLVIPILSDYLRGFLQQQNPEEAEQWAALQIPKTDAEWQNWKEQFIPEEGCIEKIVVYCESDSGLAQAEALREELANRMGSIIATTTTTTTVAVLGDTPFQLEARRHKFLMNQLVSERTDLPTVQQRLCKSLEEALDFAKELFGKGKAVVVKPYRGVASESVSLCSTKEEVETAWKSITSSSVFGSLFGKKPNDVLVQEQLVGTEYAVDVVSIGGQHKVAAIWRYDKRPANGAPFCYYQTKLIDSNSDPNVQKVCNYIQTTLTALGVKWGISHNEVIVTEKQGPVLVEINCRQHNMDFLPLVMACIGYNTFDMYLEGLFGCNNWEQYPDIPSLLAHGCMVHLVSSAKGHLVQINHLQELSNLSSVLDLEIYEEFQTPGTLIEPTTDIRSDAGWVQLINNDPLILDKDYEQIVNWMPTMFQAVAEEDMSQ